LYFYAYGKTTSQTDSSRKIKDHTGYPESWGYCRLPQTRHIEKLVLLLG